ncbi:MAG: hypothetical protein P8078_11930, partial [bacterium]
GKNAFAWSVVDEEGRRVIPADAFTEYHFRNGEKAIVMSGSKKSGGFGLTTTALLQGSPISEFLHACPQLAECTIPQGKAIKLKSKIYCWVLIDNKSIKVPLETLQMYGIKKGDYLLAVRGSGFALGFVVMGPIIQEAKKHPELKVYT